MKNNEMMKNNNEIWKETAKQTEEFAERQTENSQRITNVWYADKFGWLHSTAEDAIAANQSYD